MARQLYVNKKKMCSNEKIFARFLGLAKYYIETVANAVTKLFRKVKLNMTESSKFNLMFSHVLSKTMHSLCT